MDHVRANHLIQYGLGGERWSSMNLPREISGLILLPPNPPRCCFDPWSGIWGRTCRRASMPVMPHEFLQAARQLPGSAVPPTTRVFLEYLRRTPLRSHAENKLLSEDVRCYSPPACHIVGGRSRPNAMRICSTCFGAPRRRRMIVAWVSLLVECSFLLVLSCMRCPAPYTRDAI